MAFNSRRLGRAEAAHRARFRAAVAGKQARATAEAGDSTSRARSSTLVPGDAGAQQHGEQFGIGQRGRRPVPAGAPAVVRPTASRRFAIGDPCGSRSVAMPRARRRQPWTSRWECKLRRAPSPSAEQPNPHEQCSIGTTDILRARLARVVLGVTGGIAAYKAAELTRLLRQGGHRRRCRDDRGRERFVTPLTFQALSGRPVLTDLWESGAANAMGHIAVSRGADAILVAPASADFLAKLAQGRADDLLSTLCLARECPLLVAPAMNRQMWANKATQRNVAQLAPTASAILGPDTGELACNENGEGRMLEPEALFAALVASRQPKVLAGKRVLLTAGPTFEAIDPVRGITNSSSGQDGIRDGAGRRGSRRSGDRGRRTDAAGDTRGRHAHRRDQRRADGGGGAAGASTAATSSSPSRRSPTTRPETPSDRETQEVAGDADAHAQADGRHPGDRRRARRMRPICVGFAAESHDVLG